MIWKRQQRWMQTSVRCRQRLVDLEDVVLLLPDEILDDDIEFTAVPRIARAGNAIAGLLQIQLQRDGKRDRCWLGQLAVRIVADFREQLPVSILEACIPPDHRRARRRGIPF